MTDVISALKRLQRAGSEESRASQKLREAASVVATRIEVTLLPALQATRRSYPEERVLGIPGTDYTVVYRRDADTEWAELRLDYATLYEPGYALADPYSPAPHEVALRFARDVAEGLLDKVAALLETLAAESDAATSTLEETR